MFENVPVVPVVLRCHWYEGAGVPVATTLNVVVPVEAHRLLLVGCVEIAAAVLHDVMLIVLVMVAVELEQAVTVLVATTA